MMGTTRTWLWWQGDSSGLGGGRDLPSTRSVPGGAGRNDGVCTSPVSMGSATKTTNKTSARGHRPPPETVAGPLLQCPRHPTHPSAPTVPSPPVVPPELGWDGTVVLWTSPEVSLCPLWAPPAPMGATGWGVCGHFNSLRVVGVPWGFWVVFPVALVTWVGDTWRKGPGQGVAHG